MFKVVYHAQTLEGYLTNTKQSRVNIDAGRVLISSPKDVLKNTVLSCCQKATSDERRQRVPCTGISTLYEHCLLDLFENMRRGFYTIWVQWMQFLLIQPVLCGPTVSIRPNQCLLSTLCISTLPLILRDWPY